MYGDLPPRESDILFYLGSNFRKNKAAAMFRIFMAAFMGQTISNIISIDIHPRWNPQEEKNLVLELKLYKSCTISFVVLSPCLHHSDVE
ncbi:hypothetical protein TNCV_595051 [Trichonephila clavipes]|nr:hypothetical protein TNCV_595051 [Trichonephila clavipes]